MSEHISASQLSTWLRCPKQYEFRYLQGYKLPPRAALTRGGAAHKAWEADHLQKIKSKKNLPVEQVLDVYSSEFDTRAKETEWNPEENPGRVKDAGVRMVEVYHEAVSRKIQPVACEEPFEVEIQGHIVQGVIDLETDSGDIRDAKTAGRRKAAIPMDHQLQMAVYSRAKPKAKQFILDNAIGNERRAEMESLTIRRDELPHAKLNAYLDAFGDSLVKGAYPPTNPENWWCSERWCGFYNICKFGKGSK